MEQQNPFQDYGGIVYGERFVGRQKDIATAQGRVLGDTYGNLAIVGLPRIGKSSLAWQAFMTQERVLEENHCVVVIRVNASSFIEEEDLFFTMMMELHDRVEEIADIPRKNRFSAALEKIETAKRRAVWVRYIEKYFRTLLTTGYRVVYILDEFDAVRHYLDAEGFQLLREITYNPKLSVGLVTISRRSIQEIEIEAGSVSNLAQTFLNLHLGMFSAADMELYWENFFVKGALSKEQQAEILHFAGCHPFFLDLFNYHFYPSLLAGHTSAIEVTQAATSVIVLNAYDTVLSLLEEQKLDTKLLQVVVGPVIDLTTADVQKLEQMDLIHKSTADNTSADRAIRWGYRSFSRNFDQYLRLRKRDIPIWDMWTETEMKLRSVVQEWLEQKYGEEWIGKFQKAHPKKADYLTRLLAMQAKEKRTFPTTYSENLLDFTYPAELFDQFMVNDWSWFCQILKGQKTVWKAKFDQLARIRNPLAHNKKNILKDFELDGARSSCKEIIEKIDMHFKRAAFQPEE